MFTDGEATDEEGDQYQVEQAQELKNDKVKVITVAMGVQSTIDKFRSKMKEIASKAVDSGDPLMFESEFEDLDKIANNLVKDACDV